MSFRSARAPLFAWAASPHACAMKVRTMTDTVLPLSRLETKLQRKSAPTKREHRALTEQVRAIFELAGFDVEYDGPQLIRDEYLDTARLHLFHANASVRVRHIDGLKHLSIKKLQQQSDLGLFETSEDTKPLTEHQYQELRRHGLESVARQALSSLNERLRIVLVVQTRRSVFRLRRGNEQYRLLLDTFRFGGSRVGKSEKLFELSIESHSDNARGSLESIRAKLLRILEASGFEVATTLKYRRGVELLGIHLQRRNRARLTLNQWLTLISIVVTALSIIIGVS